GVGNRAARIKRSEIPAAGRPACMQIPQRHARIGRAGLALRCAAREDRATELQARYTAPIERAEYRKVMPFRKREFLVDRPERRLLPVCRGRVPLVEVEAGAEPTLERDAVVELPDDLDATLTPGRRNDRGFDEVALHAVVGRGLVLFVQQARW